MRDINNLFQIGMDRTIPRVVPIVGKTVLNIGAGKKLIAETISLDYPLWDADRDAIPYGDEMVDGIHCYHFLEHCQKPIFVLIEFNRVLRIGGVANIVVPYYSSSMQAQDLDHKCCFCENTWKTLFANPYYAKYKIDWRLKVGINIIIGVAERNLYLMTQLIKK
jgi:ubiquinone/menaquinone biosynthesis C-methylase UbiE